MGLNKYQKGDCTNSTVAFYQKSIYDFVNPFTDISGYFNLWDIFKFIFRQLRMTFFIKLCWQKKIIFLQMHKTSLQRVKKFLNVKMINLERNLIGKGRKSNFVPPL